MNLLLLQNKEKNSGMSLKIVLKKNLEASAIINLVNQTQNYYLRE